MEYRSPYTFLSRLGISLKELTSTNLKQLQKRILLELDLSDSEFLKINNIQISKDEILKTFKELEGTEQLTFHQLIYENDPLHHFLKTGEFRSGEDLNIKKLILKEGFKSFLSPFLVYRINRSLKKHFLRRDFKTCLIISDLTVYLEPYDQSMAYDLFAGALNELSKEVILLSKGAIKFEQTHYEFLIDDSLIKFLNYLPEEFSYKRSQLASNMNDMGTFIYEKNLKYVLKLYEALQYIRCNPELDKILSHNLAYMQGLKSKDFGYSVISVIGIAIILFFAFKFIDIVYLTTDEEKFNEKQSRNLADHLLFTDQVIKKASEIDFQELDTLRLDTVPKYPYYAFYSSLIKGNSVDDVKINIENQSSFDLIVFKLKKQGNYCFSMPAGSEKSSFVSNNDLLNFYAGNSWYSQFLINPKGGDDLSYGLKTLINNGIFTQHSDTTTALFNRFYKISGLKVNKFDISQFENYTISNKQDFNQSIIDYNASLYINKQDSIVVDSINFIIRNAPLENVIEVKPYFHLKE